MKYFIFAACFVVGLLCGYFPDWNDQTDHAGSGVEGRQEAGEPASGQASQSTNSKIGQLSPTSSQAENAFSNIKLDGGGELNGWIKEPDGKGVSGVKLSAYILPTKDLLASLNSKADLKKAGEDFQQFRKSSKRVAISQADGQFTLKDLEANRSYEVYCEKSGYCILPHHSKVAKAGTVSSWEAYKSNEVELSVVDEAGNKVEEGYIRARLKNGSSKVVTSKWIAESPLVSIPVDFHEVEFLDLNFKQRAQQSIDLVAEPTKQLELIYSEQKFIEIQVNNIPDYAGVSTRVYCRKLKDDELLEWRDFSVEEIVEDFDLEEDFVHAKLQNFEGKSSRFRIRHQGIGRYLLIVSQVGDSCIVAEVRAVGRESRSFNLGYPTLEEQGKILVRVIGPDGESLEGCQFNEENQKPTIWDLGKSKWEECGASFLNGVYLVPLHANQESLHLSSRVSCTSPTHGCLVFEVGVNSERSLVLEFQPPARLMVDLSAITDARLRNRYKLVLKGLEELPLEGSFERFKAFEFELADNDYYEFGPLVPGEYSVQLISKGHYNYAYRESGREANDERIKLISTRVQLASGLTVHQIQDPELFTLDVELSSHWFGGKLILHPQGSLGLMRVDRAEWRAVPGQALREGNGRIECSFAALPAGSYRLEFLSYLFRSDSMQLEISGDKRVEFYAGTPVGILVRVYEKDGLLYQSGFRDGDFIVGIGSVRASAAIELNFLRFGMFSENNTSYEVLRGGVSVRVEFSANPDESFENWGGEIFTSSMNGANN